MPLYHTFSKTSLHDRKDDRPVKMRKRHIGMVIIVKYFYQNNIGHMSDYATAH